jgi:DNA polymerase-2
MRGFILQPTYRIESGRPVVHLYGRLEDRHPFLIRDDTEIPHFFVRTADADRARRLGANRIHPTDLHTMDGEPVSRVEVTIPGDTPSLRDRLTSSGVPAFEADVRFAMRFLIDRGIKGAVEIDGEPRETAATPLPLRVFENPVLRRGDWTPSLKVLSLDVETDPRARRLFSIGLHGEGVAEVLYVTSGAGKAAALQEMRAKVTDRAGQAGGEGAEAGFRSTPCVSEAQLIELFCRRVAEIDPDVLTGWNVVDFDLRVLDAVARRSGRGLRLGRTSETMRMRLEEGMWRSSRAEIVGRVVLDGIDLLRGAFIRLQDYKLETAARSLVGKGKLISTGFRGEEIERLYREDLPRFLEYNLNDARLVTEILEETGVVDLSVRRSLLTGMPPDRVNASIASFDSLYLHELRRRGYVAPSVGAAEVTEGTVGGAVLDPVTGFHRNVLVFDFRSLYPSLIRTYNIDPLGLIREPEGGGSAAPLDEPKDPDAEPIRAPNGALFRREPGVLPAILDRLFSERAAARARGDGIASQAIKILMNSCYGVLATPACRFYSSAVANAITQFGQSTLMWARREAQAKGYDVLYGDTDSLFIAAGTDDPEEAGKRGGALLTSLNRELGENLREKHGVRSHLELEFQCLYHRLFLPSLRHGTAGARKRYAGLTVERGVESIEFTGMEMVRRDWTDLSKIFQQGLFDRVFHDEDPAPFVREFLDELRSGGHDDHLVYRKTLRKRISEYTATTPPHVKAAKILGAKAGQLIEYVITVYGPEPASMRTGSFDYGHYVEKQIRPVAEAILAHLDLSFDQLAGTSGGGAQMNLFE